MGLDITAFGKLVPEPNHELEDGNPKDWKNVREVYGLADVERHWPGRTQGLNEGYYRAGQMHGFRAGSYSGYNRWRDMLARYAGYGSADTVHEGRITSGPFVELINFSNCEGFIGPTVSAKLARDFAENADHIENLAKADGEEGDYFLERYAKWRKAFEIAAEGGYVHFH